MLAVLQFDSPSLAVLDRMLDAGRLPALAGLRERGVWHELETPATHFAAGAFHTLYSGTELADHGLFYPFQWSAADQRVRYTTAFPAPPPVWERPGGRALAMDPYESRPPLTPPSGTVVSGWQFTDRVVLQPWSSPPGLNARLETLFGPPAAVEEVFGRSSPRDLLRLRRDLLASSGRAADAAALLLAESTYDLTWLTFSAGHVAGHQFFDLSQLDDADAADPPRARRRAGGGLPERRRRVRPRARRAARGHGRDRDVAGRDGRQHQPRGPAARDARRGAVRRDVAPTRTPGPGSCGSCGPRCRPVCGRGSRRRCPTRWRWP